MLNGQVYLQYTSPTKFFIFRSLHISIDRHTKTLKFIKPRWVLCHYHHYHRQSVRKSNIIRVNYRIMELWLCPLFPLTAFWHWCWNPWETVKYNILTCPTRWIWENRQNFTLLQTFLVCTSRHSFRNTLENVNILCQHDFPKIQAKGSGNEFLNRYEKYFDGKV